MELYFATGNEHKKQEAQQILSGVKLVLPKERGIDFAVDECEHTFCGNSLIKAKALYDIVHSPVLADDSGLCVRALGGEPGVYSARYRGREWRQEHSCAQASDTPKLSSQEQCKLLIADLNEELALEHGDTHASTPAPAPSVLPELVGREAYFACCATLYLSPGHFYCVQETLEGYIVPDINGARGSGGFGYDPIFYLLKQKKTVAELSPSEKNAISHRALALHSIKLALQQQALF